MTTRLDSKLLLTPNDIKPSQPNKRVIGIFNPGVAEYKARAKLLIRVAEESIEDDSAKAAAPDADHREIRTKDGYYRLPFRSHLRLVTMTEDGLSVNSIEDLESLHPAGEYEEWGIEDPRITFIEQYYYITYVAVSEKMGISTCLMRTKDFATFERLGIIFPQENKDVVLFPEMINNQYVCYHRPRAFSEFRPPAILVAYSNDLLHWGGHDYVLGASPSHNAWDSFKVGGGLPPIKTNEGWLHIYHGAKKKDPKDKIGIYSAGAFLTPLDTPEEVIARSTGPILTPETDFEKNGYVSEVVFPTGFVYDKQDSDKILVYYGCADSNIAVATLSISAILEDLKENN